jgi:integrase
VVDHIDRYVAMSPEALLFGTSSDGYLARRNWNRTFRRAAKAIGLPSVRPQELRHTGATLAAATGATTKELMRRLEHSSPAAALLYPTPQTIATRSRPCPRRDAVRRFRLTDRRT